MKILVVSDSHLFDDNLNRVTELYKNQVDFMIHCGDSSLDDQDPYLQQYDIVVLGNHDTFPFPQYKVYKDICVTHGQCYQVYKGYEQLIALCHQENCHLCFHGHTHVPTHQVHDGIHFINPGSLMMNRGSYGFGTYALVEYDKHHLSVDYYHHKTDEKVSIDILEEGLELLEEFKKLV